MTQMTHWNAVQAQVRLDALVAGDLPDDERRELLAWLDADAKRWRNCGLAFLEAQLWRESLEEGSAFRVQGSGVEERKHALSSATRQGTPRSWIAPLVFLTAGIAAFVCGLFVQDWRQGRAARDQPIAAAPRPANDVPLPQADLLVASVPVRNGPLGDIAATLQIPVRPVDAAATDVGSSVPQHVRKEWERRGYQLVEQRRYLPARLPDGRQVMVPVNEVKMKFVGKPVS